MAISELNNDTVGHSSTRDKNNFYLTRNVGRDSEEPTLALGVTTSDSRPDTEESLSSQ